MNTPNPEGGDVRLPELPVVQRCKYVGGSYPMRDDPQGEYVDYDDHVAIMREYGNLCHEASRSCGVGEEGLAAGIMTHFCEALDNLNDMPVSDEWARKWAAKAEWLIGMGPKPEHQPRDAGRRARELADEWRHVLTDGKDGHDLCANRNTVAQFVNAIDRLTRALSESAGGEPAFQGRVAEWMGQCFIPSLYSNMTERSDRLLEEVLELLQATGYDRDRVPTLVEYVFNRPAGEPSQEVGGVMVTLAGFCWIAGLNMHADGERELARITQPEIMEKIRRKQEAKNALHFDTPLPGYTAPARASGGDFVLVPREPTDAMLDAAWDAGEEARRLDRSPYSHEIYAAMIAAAGGGETDA